MGMGKRGHSPNLDLNSQHSDGSHGSHYPLKKSRGEINLTNSEKRRRQTGTSQGKSMTKCRRGCPVCCRMKTSLDKMTEVVGEMNDRLGSLERLIRTMIAPPPPPPAPPPPPPNFLQPQPKLRRPFITLEELKKVKLRKTGLL